LVYGQMKETQGQIAYSIIRSKKNYSKFTTGPGKDAVTDFEVVSFCLDPKRHQEYTFLKAWPKTGRTHQIRVHLKAKGYPIVSDMKYCFKNQRKINPLPRLFLHAHQISFDDPSTGVRQEFKAPLAQDLKDYLDTLTCSSPSEASPEVAPLP